MSEIVSFAARLKQQLQGIEEQMMGLLDISTIKKSQNDPSSFFVILRPPYYWGKSDKQQERMQMQVKEAYSNWFEQFSLLFRNAPPEIDKRLEDTNSFVGRWIDKSRVNWEVQPTIEQCKQKFHERIQVFYQLIPDEPDEPELILVPDTNALIQSPEPSQYSQVVGKEKYDFVLTPTVLQELEILKKGERKQDFHEKVKSVIRRIKGWRNQGSLLQGVTVNKTVNVRAIAQEPDLEHTLGWLDASRNDDRIIATVFEIQRAQPTAKVVLVTSDVNLQNKAEMANLPYSEPPEQRKKEV